MKLLAATSLLLFLMMFESSHGICHKEWKRVPQKGEKSLEMVRKLLHMISIGNKLRVKIINQDMTFDPDWITVNYFEKVISAESYMDFPDYNVRFNVTTNGIVERRAVIGNRINQIKEYDLLWFSKPISQGNEYTLIYKNIFPDLITQGNKTNFINAVKDGHEMYVFVNDSFFPLHVLVANTDSVLAYNVWHFSSGGKNAEYSRSASLSRIFTILSSTGEVQHLEKTHIFEVSAHSKAETILWFVDPCWKEIYVHDEHGTPVRGSRDNLIKAIKTGHRVRVGVNSRYTETSKVFILTNQHVSAQVTNQINVTIFLSNGNVSDVYWNWMMASTNGRIHSYICRTDDLSLQRKTTYRGGIYWYVDTHVVEKFSVLKQGERNLRTLQRLQEAFSFGSSLRIGIVEKTAPTSYSAVNTVYLKSNTRKLEAKAVWSVKVKADREGELVITDHPKMETTYFHFNGKVVTDFGPRYKSKRFSKHVRQMDWFVER